MNLNGWGFIGLCFLIISGCQRDHHGPIASLTFVRAEKTDKFAYYDIYFSSDRDLDDVYPDPITQFLICSLEPRPVFERDHVIPIFGLAEIRPNPEVRGFSYIANMHFSETKDGGISDSFIYKDRFKKLTAGLESVPCKVYMTSFGFKAYYSSSMMVPLADLLPLIPEKPPFVPL